MAIERNYKSVWVCQECSAEIGTVVTCVEIAGVSYDLTISEDNACETHQLSYPSHLIFKKEDYLILEDPGA